LLSRTAPATAQHGDCPINVANRQDQAIIRKDRGTARTTLFCTFGLRKLDGGQWLLLQFEGAKESAQRLET
jgi:hypothetical protein